MLDIITRPAPTPTVINGDTMTSAIGVKPSLFQRSIQTAVTCHGVALHSGKDVSIRLVPAPANHGIVFKRTDIAATGDAALIPAVYSNVRSTALCTEVSNANGHGVMTIEHLMAAIAASEIDNLLIEIDGPEVPVMDGSSAPFLFLLECAGIIEQSEPRVYIEVLKPISVSENNGHGPKSAILLPHNQFHIDCEIDFAASAIGKQQFSLTVTPGSFKNDVSRARTFGFLQDVEKMRAAGLGLGGNLENSVVIDGDRVINPDGLRYSNEFVRHKVLDCVGDLYLAGYPLLARVETYRAGHAMNNQLLRALFADSSAWRLVKPIDRFSLTDEQDNSRDSLKESA